MAIINPAAGKGRGAAVWAAHAAALEDVLGKIDVLTSERPDHMDDLVHRALAGDCRHLIVCGGDGTINETVNALMAAGVDRPDDLVLTPLPGGTANAVVDNLKLGGGPEAVARALSHGWQVELDLLTAACVDGEGREIERYALVAVSFGAVAEMMRRANEAQNLKRWAGMLGYHVAALRAAWSYPAFEVDVAFEGKSRRRRLRAGVIANMPRAGGAAIAPSARFDDGLFDAVLIGDLPFLRRAIVAPLQLWRGRISHVDGIDIIRGHSLSVTGPAKPPVDADGEWIGYAPLSVEIASVSLNFTASLPAL